MSFGILANPECGVNHETVVMHTNVAELKNSHDSDDRMLFLVHNNVQRAQKMSFDHQDVPAMLKLGPREPIACFQRGLTLEPSERLTNDYRVGVTMFR